MGRTCAAPNCNSGYKNVDMTGISMHAFQKEWKGKIHRDGEWKITDNIGLCSKHFVAEDFVTESSSSNARGNRKRKGQKLDKRYLKPDAIPTIFPNCPEHLTKDRQPRRSANATAETRNETAEKRKEEERKQREEADALPDLKDLRRRVDARP